MSNPRSLPRLIVGTFALAGLVVLAACGADDDTAEQLPIDVEAPWARATVVGQPHGAVYLEVTADHDDTLTGASVPASVADRAEIHEMVSADEGHDTDGMGDMDDMDDMDMGEGEHEGMAPGMIMREVDGGLTLPAGEPVVLAPGGYHVMLVDLADQLEIGHEFPLTLTFAGHDDVTITVPVVETAP